MPYNIVVAHYNEDLKWLTPFDSKSIIVYSKGKPSEIDCIQRYLPNIGNESHTYLTYILENYDNLPEIIFFTQGSIDDHYISSDKDNIINTFLNIDTHSQNYRKCLFNVGLDHKYRLSEYNKHILQMFNMSGKDFFKMYVNKDIDLKDPIYIYFYGIFSIKKEYILSRTKEYYKILLSLLTSVQSEVGHFFERSWFYIFNLDKEENNLFNLIKKEYRRDNKIRLHILGVPHTVTKDEFSNCAFTGKILRFPIMMKSVEYEVYHYGIEGAQTEADKQIDVLKLDEWNDLKFKSYKQLFPKLTDEEIIIKLKDSTRMLGELANYSTPLYIEFNSRVKNLLKQNYRSTETDIVCLPYGLGHKAAIENENFIVVESGIGYNDSFCNYRIFESYAWLHGVQGKANDLWGKNYYFVVPNYFDSKKWPLSLTPKKQLGYLGRVYDGKGLYIIVEIAKMFPNIEFIICGQGDPKPFLTTPNIIYKPPIHGEERGEYLGSLTALLAPTLFIEPFCGVAVEAQLCGTPVITTDYGAQTETVESFKTGVHCHTLGDYCTGVQMALDGVFDRQYIHRRAVKKYDMYNVAKKYDYAFKTIMDVHNGNGGWYSKNSYLELLKDD